MFGESLTGCKTFLQMQGRYSRRMKLAGSGQAVTGLDGGVNLKGGVSGNSWTSRPRTLSSTDLQFIFWGCVQVELLPALLSVKAQQLAACVKSPFLHVEGCCSPPPAETLPWCQLFHSQGRALLLCRVCSVGQGSFFCRPQVWQAWSLSWPSVGIAFPSCMPILPHFLSILAIFAIHSAFCP